MRRASRARLIAIGNFDIGVGTHIMFTLIPSSSFSPSARERIAMLVPMIASRLHRMRPGAKSDNLADLSHMPPGTRKLAGGINQAWMTLARRLNVPITTPTAPCCGPGCTATTAPQACSKCQVARFHSLDCLRCVAEIDAAHSAGLPGRCTKSNALPFAASSEAAHAGLRPPSVSSSGAGDARRNIGNRSRVADFSCYNVDHISSEQLDSPSADRYARVV